MTWTNEDGLVVRFGKENAEVVNQGTTAANVKKSLVHKFDYTDIADTDTTAPDPLLPVIPAGSVIVSATLYVTTAFVGATGTLDIGLKTADGTNTDDDGIDAAIAVTALDAVGDVIQCDGAYVMDQTGNLTGIRLTADQYIMTTYDTAAFTAGAATLVVEYLEIE